MTAQVDLMEAIGAGPDSETTVSTVTILSADAHSGTVAPLRRASSGLTVYSYERWLRLRFTDQSVYVQTIRFWIDNLAPNPGWLLSMGVASDYQKPTNVRSAVAFQAIPTVDPGVGNPNLYPTFGTIDGVDLNSHIDNYSPWLVLQAAWSATDGDPFQAAELNFNFAWSEF